MFMHRLAILAFVAGLVGAPTVSRAETYRLASPKDANDLSLVELTLKAAGTLTLAGQGKTRELPMSVQARINYEERMTSAAPGPDTAARSFRYYRQAEAAIKIDKGAQNPVLGEAHRLIAAQTKGGTNTLFCPTAPLKREELDLIDVPAGTLAVNALLPADRVTVGATWKHSDEVLQALLGLDAVSLTDVQSVFGQVKDNLAEVTLAGTVHGATGGVSTQIDLKARYYYDLTLKRITRFAMLTKEKRGVGHVSPGLEVIAKLTMRISPLEESSHLSDDALADLSNVPSPESTRLSFESERGKFRLVYDRRWDLTSTDPTLAVMRLVDRGELIAQCNVTPLAPVSAGKLTMLPEFQEDVKKTLGKNFGQFVKVSQKSGFANVRILRVVASGEVSQLPIQWIYYLVANENGQQTSLVFTLESSLAERFSDADRTLVSSLRFTDAPETTAAKPTPATPKTAQKTRSDRTAAKPSKEISPQ